MGELKRRKNNATKKAKRVKKEGAPSAARPPTSAHEADGASSLRGHWALPLFLITVVVLCPYGIYLLYHCAFLQYPEVVATLSLGLVKPRPSVGEKDIRQVLIVGTMSSGTSQTAHELSKVFKLEVGHENANTAWHFVRDGVVSWFHGIRFLDWRHVNADDLERVRVRSFANICSNFTPSMGFHPSMYRESACSSRQKWSNCWIRECLEVLHAEWGCAVLPNRSCVTPFQTTLHQTRHPLRTIESLVAKFCIGDASGPVHPSFMLYASSLFPTVNFTGMPCIEVAGNYVLEYNSAMLLAAKKKVIAGRYQVEETSPCDISKMGGFVDSPVLPSNRKRVREVCDSDSQDHPARQVMVSTAYKVNKGKVQLSWDDLKRGISSGKKLHDALLRLTNDLDYSP